MRVVGVDLAAGRGVTEVAPLCLREGDLPEYRIADHHAVSTDDEIVAAIARVQPSVVAIDAPLSLPRIVAAALLGATAAHAAGSSPYTRAAERDLLWSRLGMRPLPVSFLGGLTFRAISLLPRLRSALPETTVIEAFPSGALAALGISRLGPDGARRGKSTPTSRACVQRGLASFISGMPAPEENLLSADLLDALAAALTASAYAAGEYLVAGEDDEGQIVVPRPR